MAEKFTSPSGDVYTWEGSEPPTQDDLNKIIEADAKRGVMKAQWAYGSPMERVGLMAKWGGNALLDLGIEGASAAAGQTIGERLGGPAKKITGPVGGFIGGATGNFIVQAKRIASGEQDKIKGGQILGAGLAAANPGRNMAKGGVAGQAVRDVAGNVAAKAVETEIDEDRLPTGQEVGGAAAGAAVGVGLAKAQDTMKAANGGVSRAAKAATRMGQDSQRNATFQMAAQLGYGLDPALSNPTAITKFVDRVAGQSQVQRALIFRNQKVTNEIARAEIGLPVNEPLSRPNLLRRRYELSEPYREVAQINAQASADLEALNKARFKARDAWRKYAEKGDSDFRDIAEAAGKEADVLEGKLETTAAKAGKVALVDELREARRLIAKVHVVEAALNPGSGDVAANVIGRMLDGGHSKLDGGLEVIGRLENAMPQVMREAAITQGVGTQSFKPLLPVVGAGLGALRGGTEGAMAGGFLGHAASAYAPIPMRNIATSKTFQQAMAMPTYATGSPDMLSDVMRYGAQAAGRR